MKHLIKILPIKPLIVCLLNCFYTFSYSQEIGNPMIRNYTAQEYNNSPQVMSVIKDNRGVMYFGVETGIMEYDGVSWRLIPVDQQSRPYDFAMDKKGRIYVGASKEIGYLAIDNKGNTIYKSLTHLIKDTLFVLSTTYTVRITSKYVYFSTNEAVLQYNPEENLISLFKAKTGDIFDESFVVQDIYYILSRNNILKLENNSLVPLKQKKIAFGTTTIYDSCSVLGMTADNLYSFQPNMNTEAAIFKLSSNDFITNNRIYCSSSFLNKYFIIGSLNKGAMLFDKTGSVLQQYNESNLLQNNFVIDIAHDKNENLWFGLSNGISKTEHSLDLSYWDKNSGLKDAVTSVIRFNNTIYISTLSGVYYIDTTNQIKEIENIPKKPNWCFLEDKNTQTLLCGTSNGIYEIKEFKAKEIISDLDAFFLFQSNKNPDRIYSTNNYSFISLKYTNGKWINEGEWEGIYDKNRAIIEDKNGDIWLTAYRSGIIRITPDFDNITKPKKVRYYKENNGLPDLKSNIPFYLQDKIIWGTANGLFIYNSQTDYFEPFCELGKQFCDGNRDVFSFKEMPDGKIWILPGENKDADIGYLKPNNNGTCDWIFAPFRRIPKMSLSPIYIEPTGIVWISGSEGLYRYDASKDTKDYLQEYNCLIRKVTIAPDSLIFGGHKSQNLPDSIIVIKFEYNSLKFEFAAPFFDQEEKTLYRFYLEGFDKEWSKWDYLTTKEYTNLNEGTYRFNVKAKNIYDVESITSSFQFIVKPPLYRTWWAYFLYVLMIVLIVIFIIKLYTRRLVQQKEHLEEIVSERTDEILKKNEELKQQKEEISATLEVVSQQKKEIEDAQKQTNASISYAQRIQNAVLPNQKFIDTLLKEHFIFFKPRDIVSGDFYFIKQINDYFLIAAADCTGHGVPGAFMSMLGIAILNEITQKTEIMHSNQILNDLRRQIKNSLNQTGKIGEQQDGMDIAFCAINTTTLEMSFAGAYNPCWIFRTTNNETNLIELAADRMPVGIHIKEKDFSEQIFQLQKGDVFYIFSDGYYSQFGGAANNKYKTKRLREFLQTNYHKSLSEQKEAIENEFNTWKGSNLQTDDVLVIGVGV